MIALSEAPVKQFILPNEEDFIFDNTPLSPEEEQIMAQMIQKLKEESGDTNSVKVPTKTEEEERLLQAFLEKSRILSQRWHAHFTAQNAVFTEGS
jgi:hypothetical protein